MSFIFILRPEMKWDNNIKMDFINSSFINVKWIAQIGTQFSVALSNSSVNFSDFINERKKVCH